MSYIPSSFHLKTLITKSQVKLGSQSQWPHQISSLHSQLHPLPPELKPMDRFESQRACFNPLASSINVSTTALSYFISEAGLLAPLSDYPSPAFPLFSLSLRSSSSPLSCFLYIASSLQLSISSLLSLFHTFSLSLCLSINFSPSLTILFLCLLMYPIFLFNALSLPLPFHLLSRSQRPRAPSSGLSHI